MFKLVRDRIPELIQQSGQICNYAEAKNLELFGELLRAKLIEEVNEFLSTGKVEELADISLVIETIAGILGYSEEQFKKVCVDKIEEHGKFENKYIIFLPDQLVKSETTNETK